MYCVCIFFLSFFSFLFHFECLPSHPWHLTFKDACDVFLSHGRWFTFSSSLVVVDWVYKTMVLVDWVYKTMVLVDWVYKAMVLVDWVYKAMVLVDWVYKAMVLVDWVYKTRLLAPLLGKLFSTVWRFEGLRHYRFLLAQSQEHGTIDCMLPGDRGAEKDCQAARRVMR